MATQVQFRRGTTGEHSGFTGAVGEVTVDTQKKTVCIHDASTLGGFPLLLEDGSNSSLSLGSLSSCALKFAGDSNTGIMSPGPDQISLVTGGFARLTIDSTVTTLTGTQTLTNKSLTAPVLTGSSSSAGSIVFKEDTDNGTNSATLKGPAATADVTLTLPATDGTVSTESFATAIAVALG